MNRVEKYAVVAVITIVLLWALAIQFNRIKEFFGFDTVASLRAQKEALAKVNESLAQANAENAALQEKLRALEAEKDTLLLQLQQTHKTQAQQTQEVLDERDKKITPVIQKVVVEKKAVTKPTEIIVDTATLNEVSKANIEALWSAYHNATSSK